MTEPVPLNPSSAVKVAAYTSGSPVADRPVTTPPTASISAAVNPTGTSLKVKVTTELVSPSFSESSAMSTLSVGLILSTATLSLPAPPRFRAASV